MTREDRFNFAQFDTKAANFDLKIFAAFEANATVGEATAEISGAIDAIRVCTLPDGRVSATKCCVGGFRISPVAQGDMLRLDRDLALNLHRLALIAKQKNFGVFDWKSRGNAFTGDGCALIDKVLQSDCCFAGAKAVHQSAVVREMLPTRLNVVAVYFFAALNEPAGTGEILSAPAERHGGGGFVLIDFLCRWALTI